MSRNDRNNPNPNPATSADLLKNIWKVIKPNSRKNPSEEDVFEALGLLAENNKKAVEAGKEQSRLLKEAEAKAREEQAKKDKEELEKLKAAHAKELEGLKAAHAKELEDLKTAHKKELEKLKGMQPVSGGGSTGASVFELADMTEEQKKRVCENAKKLQEVAEANRELGEEMKYMRAACAFHI